MKEGRILVENAPIHYRIGGEGPPILLLHPSPSSSLSQLPLANQLTDHFTVICPDTPGYGESPSFESTEYSMESYTRRLHSFVKVLGIDQFAIYGSATGGQIAIRYGLMYPNDIIHLFLDNCAHFPKDLRTNIIDNYFPDLTPRLDGSHLSKIWEIATHLFKYFPWCCKTEEYKVNLPELPVEIYQKVAMEYLVAGEHYYRAYRTAFHHEKVDHIIDLKVPATIIRWQGSIVKKYTDIIFESTLPKNVGEVSIPAGSDDRFPVMKSLIIEKYISDTSYNTPSESQLIEEFISERDQKINAFSKLPSPPALRKDGSHLTEAWKILKNNSTSDDPHSIQKDLVNWYKYADSI